MVLAVTKAPNHVPRLNKTVLSSNHKFNVLWNIWMCRLMHTGSMADHCRHRVQRLQNCVAH